MNAKEKLINEIQGSENYVGAANDISAKDQLRTSGWIAGNFIIRPASKGAPHDFTLGFIDQSHAYRKVRIYLTHHVNNDFAYLAFTPIASERERFQTFANLTAGVSEIRGRDEIRALANATAGEAKADTNLDSNVKTYANKILNKTSTMTPEDKSLFLETIKLGLKDTDNFLATHVLTTPVEFAAANLITDLVVASYHLPGEEARNLMHKILEHIKTPQTNTARLFQPSKEAQAGAAAAPNPQQNQSTNEFK